MRLIVCVIMSVIVIASLPEEALAADEVRDENEGNRPMISTSLSVEKTEGANINDTSASIGHTEFSAGLEWLFLLFDIDHREYEWEKSASFDNNPKIEPWQTLTRIAPGLQYYHKFNEKWGVWPKFVVISGFEDEISSQSWTYNPQVIGTYILTQGMTIYGGLGMLYHTVDPLVYPVLGVAWNMKSKDGLSGTVGFPKTMIHYGFNERVALKMDFQTDIRFYQLAEDNDWASEGYVKTEDLKLSLQIEYKPKMGVTLFFGGRQYFGRKLTVFDHQKNELTSNDVSGSLAFFLGIDYQF